MKRLLCLALLLAAGARAEDDAAKYLQFVEENTGSCVQRKAACRSRCATRTRRAASRSGSTANHQGPAWAHAIGDRSRSELAPAPSRERWAARAAMPASRSGASCGRFRGLS